MDSSPRRSTVDLPPVAGVKRPASSPALLPAFELYSSPPLPRPAKRVARGQQTQYSPSKCSSFKYRDEISKYPTPVPTSSTGMFSSSPPPIPHTRRPGLQRTISTVSERAPLVSVPSVELDPTGEPLLMGRSGKSSHYQLSTNKLISRVHVQAVYIEATPFSVSKIEIVCRGWNGAKIHCQGKAWELGKDDSFTSESQDAEIMVDVQDARVLLRWPRLARKANTPEDTDSNADSENSPRRSVNDIVRRSPFSSPLRKRVRLQSPVSPTPAPDQNLASPSSLLGENTEPQEAVKIYEDEVSDHENPDHPGATQQSTQRLSQPLGINNDLPQSDLQEFSDQDEENDPVIHSFGPYGENLLPRMASFTAGYSPKDNQVDAVKESSASPHKKLADDSSSPILNHIINQLAYSRLSSTPLSTIMSHLPKELKTGSTGFTSGRPLSLDMLKVLVDRTACLGEVTRAGKDAAGKPLESEYYYIPDKDFDEKRRDAVVDGLRKPGLRECRKQHKVIYSIMIFNMRAHQFLAILLA